jgi:hypothetical protein
VYALEVQRKISNFFGSKLGKTDTVCKNHQQLRTKYCFKELLSYSVKKKIKFRETGSLRIMC